jgi:ribosomal protein L31
MKSFAYNTMKIRGSNMAKKLSIHHKYKPIKVIFTTGEEVTMRSTFEPKDGGRIMRLEVDPNTQAAWTGVFGGASRTSEGTKFDNRYKGLNYLSISKK